MIRAENEITLVRVDDGEQGPQGEQGYTPYISNGYWYINGASTNVKAEGTDGDTAEWYYGTAMTGTGTKTVTISGAVVGAMYLNTSTSEIYKCTATNTWTYAGVITDPVAQEKAYEAITRVAAIETDYVKATTLEADVAQFGFAKADAIAADYVKAATLEATVAQLGFVKAATVEANYVKASSLEADVAQLGFLRADSAVITTLQTGKLSTDFANINHGSLNVAQIGTLFNEVGLIDSATIVDGHITGYLDAVEVNANKITAGTLITERLLLAGTATGNTSVLYELNNLGQLTSQNASSLDGYVITDRTLTKDKIVANTITANEVNVNSLKAALITAENIEALNLTAFDLTAWNATIGGFHIGTDSLYSPPSSFSWDCTTETSERTTLNTLLGLSEDTSTWTYDDLTSSEMSTLNTLLGLSESTSSWDEDVTIAEYKALCNIFGIPYQFGRSVYLGNDAISIGEDFFVDEYGYMIATAGEIGDLEIADGGLEYGTYGDENYLKLSGATGLQLGQYFGVDERGYMVASAGKIGDLEIAEGGLEYGTYGDANYLKLSGDEGLKLGQYFDVTTSGVVNMRRGIFGGFTIVPASGGNDYLVSDYSIGSVDYRTWIRSAEETDGGATWAFSAQVKKSSDALYYGAFVAKANGDMYCRPYDSNGDVAGPSFWTTTKGVFLYPNAQVTSQPNLYWKATGSDDNLHRVYYTTWTSSSEQIKKAINEITDVRLDPKNLYDLDIIQFQYKDKFIDENDIRHGQDLIGFLIEDLDRKYPVAVDKGDPKDPKTWNWNSAYLIPAMMKLLQDQHKEIEELKRKVS